MGLINQSFFSEDFGYFDIMHKDRKVARIYQDGHTMIYYPSFMPYNLHLVKGDDISSRLSNFDSFFHWCSSRTITSDRKYAKEILNSIGATQSSTDRDRAAITISYHGVSLLDVYWIKRKKENLTFKEINLYEHSLSDTFVDVSLRGKSLTVTNHELHEPKDEAADLGTPGVAPKAWIRRNGTFYLLKDGDKRDVDAEILASKIVQCFDVKSVIYTESTFQDQVVSKSTIITSIDTSIVPVEFVEIYCANHDKKTLKFVLEKDAYNFHMMNIMDYLIGNTDRHWGNWGFYVDNATNKIQKLYPLMDFNKAFLSYTTMDGTRCQTYLDEVLSQKEAAIIAVEKIGLNQIHDVNPDWFKNEEVRDMFFKRLELLKTAIPEALK